MPAHLPRELLEHVAGEKGFGKDRVGASLDIEAGAGDGAVEAFAGGGVGAGDDDEVAAGAGGGGDLGGHVVRSGEAFVVEVAAFLGEQLVFEMHGAGAGFLESADGVHDVERFAVAGVAVDKERQARRAGDLADEKADLVDRDDAEVGNAHGGGHRRTREVEGFKPCGFGLEGGLAVVGAWELQDPVLFEEGAQADAGGAAGRSAATR